MKKGPRKYSPSRPSSGKKTKAEAIRVWDKLDTSKRGFVTVHDVLKQAKLLETECPDFIREYESVARDGRVTRGAFLEYLVGKAATAEDRQRNVDMVQLRRMFDEVAGSCSFVGFVLLCFISAKMQFQPASELARALWCSVCRLRSGRPNTRCGSDQTPRPHTGADISFVGAIAEIQALSAKKHWLFHCNVVSCGQAVFPPLLDKFSEIDLSMSSTVSWAELEVYAGGTGEWLEYQLDRVVPSAALNWDAGVWHGRGGEQNPLWPQVYK